MGMRPPDVLVGTLYQLLRPLPDRLDLVVVAHEGDDLARRVANERVRHVRLVRVDAVLRRRLPRAEDDDLAADVAVRQRHFRSYPDGGGIDLSGIDYPHV